MSGGADNANVPYSTTVNEIAQKFGVDEKTAVHILAFVTEKSQEKFNKWYTNTSIRINVDLLAIQELINELWEESSQIVPCKAPCARHLEKNFKKIMLIISKHDTRDEGYLQNGTNEK